MNENSSISIKGSLLSGINNDIDDPWISNPIKYEKVFSVGFNPDTMEFENIPEKWKEVLA